MSYTRRLSCSCSSQWEHEISHNNKWFPSSVNFWLEALCQCCDLVGEKWNARTQVNFLMLSRDFGLVLVLQRLRVTIASVYRQLYRHCSETLEPMAPVDLTGWARARETVHIYGDTRDGPQTVPCKDPPGPLGKVFWAPVVRCNGIRNCNTQKIFYTQKGKTRNVICTNSPFRPLRQQMKRIDRQISCRANKLHQLDHMP
jgi:hypothetical protein